MSQNQVSQNHTSQDLPHKETMKAVVYEGNGILRLEERPIPHLMTPRDAVVRVTLTTICSSDIHILHGAVPRAVPGTILGHEFVGIVEEAGSEVTRVKPGDRVAVNVETFCGECFYCQRGYVNNCTDEHGGWALGCRIDGGQSEYVRIPFADNGLTPIPDSVTDEAALLRGTSYPPATGARGLLRSGRAARRPSSEPALPAYVP